MGMMSEFKAFALKGNVVDLAVAVIIGGAFGAIVSSLVSDLMMPIVGRATGGISFADQAIVLEPAVVDGAGVITKPAVLLAYGKFIDAVIKFVIVAFCLFLVIKAMNAAKKKQAAAPPAPSRQEVLLEEIRDLLRLRSTAPIVREAGSGPGSRPSA